MTASRVKGIVLEELAACAVRAERGEYPASLRGGSAGDTRAGRGR